MDSYFRYWGKAQKESDDMDSMCHLLPYHCLDVAAVGYEYLSLHDRLSQFFCDETEFTREEWLNWAAFWLSLHDLGKFSEAFQSQRPDIFSELQQIEPGPIRYTERHDSLGQWLWVDRLSSLASEENWFGNECQAGLDAWMRAVTGHHGQPPKISQHSASDEYFRKKDRTAVIEFIAQIRGLLDVPSIPSGLETQFEKVSSKLSWWFAGVAVLADWLGSNTDYFPYKNSLISLGEYWNLAREQARKALRDSGVIPGAIRPEIQFVELFPEIATPSPLQNLALTVDIDKTPQIFLLEDVTGAGKTEAALTLAYRLMEAGNADGLFVALPTMATANAMYERVASFYRRLFEGNANLVLAHGSRNLVEDFAKTVIHVSKAENDAEQADESATARCTAWLSDHNKRALLAQAGVGTIDQALLGVLHSKHQSLRLLGLFGKVLIIDEVHACDAYMQGVLEILLEFHARSGGSAILLSATLPVHMKQALLSAYSRGRQASVPAIAESGYPLVTHWKSTQPSNLVEIPLETRSSVSRKVDVKCQSDIDVVVREIEQALAKGQCACWIRNTVSDAMDAFAIFNSILPSESITLFHARFTLNDRLGKEEFVLNHFGKRSTNEQRQGRLVIATQVIEQSLDVDFDLLVSDLAPIDRLVQRAGRLHRHTRDASGNRVLDEQAFDSRGMAVMHVYAPAWEESPSVEWFKSFLPKASFVYPHHAQLWLTAKALKKGFIAMPDDARELIESVFGEEADIPAGLQTNSLTVEGQQLADASQAKNNTLTFAGGYRRGDVLDWWSEAKTPSRLGEASVNVVLARWESGRLTPWVQRPNAWAYSTVRVSEHLIAEASIPTDQQEEFQRVLETLPGQGKWSVLLPLAEIKHGIFVAHAWTQESKFKPASVQAWQYDADFGLRLRGSEAMEGESE